MSLIPNPVWPSLLVCCDTFLPAFESAKRAEQFHEHYAPGTPFRGAFECEHCGQWHYEVRAKPPSIKLNAKDQFTALRKTLK